MIGVGFIYFRTLSLAHLDAAWYSLSRQDFTDVGHVVMLDNNTDDDPAAIEAVLDRYPIPVPRVLCFAKHGDLNRTQSWSVNTIADLVQADWLFLTRADFLLDYQCLTRFQAVRAERPPSWRGFVTSYCHQMGYDDALSNTDALAPYSLSDAPWRTDPAGPASLIGRVPACYFQTTDQDAGVWLTRRCHIREVGGLDERLVSWGYQQQVFQRALSRAGIDTVVIPDYLYHHQHHWAPRDFQQAAYELSRAGV